MKRLFAQLFFFLTIGISGQAQPNLTNDPAIVTGKTDNGFTYYLVKDSKTCKGFADFFIIQKGGTAVEDESRKGMTSLLSGMNIWESRGFPDGSVFTTLGSDGMVPDNSFYYQIDKEKVVVGLRHVPIGNGANIENDALTALANMCSCAELTEETFEVGKALHCHNTVLFQSPEIRAENDLFRSFPASEKSAALSPYEEIDNVRSMNLAQISDFRKQWFRSSLQAIIVIGDIDIPSIKSKISLISGLVPKGNDSDTLKVLPFDVRKGSEHFHSYTDREATSASISIDFIQEPVPQDKQASLATFVTEHINEILCELVCDRIRQYSASVDFPIYSFNVKQNGFCGLYRYDGITLNIQTSPDNAAKAVSFLSSVINGLKGGVTGEEFAVASGRNTERTGHFAKFGPPDPLKHYAIGCGHHFLTNRPLPSAENVRIYESKLDKNLTFDKMNEYINSFFEGDTYDVIRCVSPAVVPEEELRAAFLQGNAYSPAPPAVENGGEQQEPHPVRSKTPVTEPIIGSLIYNLPNYSKVYFKKTDAVPGEISILGIAKGGLSLAEKSQLGLLRYADRIAILSVPETFDSPSITLKRSFTPDRCYLEAQCDVEELETLFKSLRESFLSWHFDESSFRREMKRVTSEDANSYSSPEKRMEDLKSLSLTIAKEKNRYSLSYSDAENFFERVCSNIGDYTFLIAGDCSEEEIRTLAERYLATIPGKKTQPKSIPEVYTFNPSESHTESMEMEFPRHLFSMRMTGNIEYSRSGIFEAEIISLLVRQKVSEMLFREGIANSTDEEISRFPSDRMTLEFNFTSPEDIAYYERFLAEVLDTLASEGVDNAHVDMAKKNIMAIISKREHFDNDIWIEMMEARLNGRDFVSKRDEIMASISYEQVNDALKRFVSGASRQTNHILPEVITIPPFPEIEYVTVFDTLFDMAAELEALKTTLNIQNEPPAEETTGEETETKEPADTTEATDTTKVTTEIETVTEKEEPTGEVTGDDTSNR